MKFGNSDYKGMVWNGKLIPGGQHAGPAGQGATTGGLSVQRVNPNPPQPSVQMPPGQVAGPMPGQMPMQAMPQQMPQQMPMPQMPPPQMPMPQAMPGPVNGGPMMPQAPPQPGPSRAFRVGGATPPPVTGGSPMVNPIVNSSPLPPMQVPAHVLQPPQMPQAPPPQATAGWGASTPIPQGIPAFQTQAAPSPAQDPIPASYTPPPAAPPQPPPVMPAAPAPQAQAPVPAPPPPPVMEPPPTQVSGPPEGVVAEATPPPSAPEPAPAEQAQPQLQPGPISTAPVFVPGMNLQSDQILMQQITPQQMELANATQQPPIGGRTIEDHQRPVFRTAYGRASEVGGPTPMSGHVQPRYGQFVVEAPNANAHVQAAQNVTVPFGASQVLMPPPPPPHMM